EVFSFPTHPSGPKPVSESSVRLPELLLSAKAGEGLGKLNPLSPKPNTPSRSRTRTASFEARHDVRFTIGARGGGKGSLQPLRRGRRGLNCEGSRQRPSGRYNTGKHAEGAAPAGEAV